MSTAELTPRPLRVSPTIKFFRWTFLSLGIVYGALRYKRLKKKEDARRAEEARLKPERDAKLAVERKKAYQEEMNYLKSIIGAEI